MMVAYMAVSALKTALRRSGWDKGPGRGSNDIVGSRRKEISCGFGIASFDQEEEAVYLSIEMLGGGK